MQKMRLGFIGAGFIAKFHASALRYVRTADLTGVYAIKGSEDLAAYAKSNGLGDCKVYSSIAELCKNSDAIAILAPNFARIEIVGQIAEAVKAGAKLKGVMCEKPLGRTVKEAKELVRMMKEVNLPTA